MTMSEPAKELSVDDILLLAKALPRDDQLRLARTLLEPEVVSGDDLVAKRRAGIGRYAGRGWIAEDFDGPLPPEIQGSFEGEDDASWEPPVLAGEGKWIGGSLRREDLYDDDKEIP